MTMKLSKDEVYSLFGKAYIYIPKRNEHEQNVSKSLSKSFVKASLKNMKCIYFFMFSLFWPDFFYNLV